MTIETPEVHVLTENQVEKLSIGVWAAGGLVAYAVTQAVIIAFFLAGIKQSVASVDAKVETVQENQQEGQDRAEVRQEKLEARVDQVGEISRDRNMALDGRIRPLEASAAAAAATLSSLNQNVLQLGADNRDTQKILAQILQQLAERPEAAE